MATDECASQFRQKSQRGASLVVSLVLLTAIMLLGATTARLTLQGEKAARNERDFRMAFFAAQAALQDAQTDIEREAQRDKKVFLPPDPVVFTSGCGSKAQGKSHGLCTPAADGQPPVWLTVDLRDTRNATARTVTYGAYTGRQFPAGQGPLPVEPPRYLIELLGTDADREPNPGDDPPIHAVYRITAIGFGMRESTHVVLQAVYRRDRVPNELKESDDDPPYHYRSRRLRWREIPHWQELRDASESK